MIGLLYSNLYGGLLYFSLGSTNGGELPSLATEASVTAHMTSVADTYLSRYPVTLEYLAKTYKRLSDTSSASLD